MATVYDLAVAARHLASDAADCDDADLDAIDARIVGWLDSADANGEACAAAHRALAAEAEHWRAEASRLMARAKRADRAAALVAERATALVLAAEAIGGEGVRVGPLRMQRNAGRVVVEVPEALPEAMWIVRREPNKTAIAAAIKAGESIPGARVEPSRSIRGL